MNKNKYIIVLLISIFLFNPISIKALEYPKTDSKIVEIYDLTDKKVLYEVDSLKEVSIASLTKIVTTITAIETIPNLDEKVTITYDILSTVPWDASKAGLEVGDQVTYRDLLFASMIPSGADATNSIAILSSGSIDNFVKKMNDLVTKLKLKHTHFVNVTGYDADGHYSTADDVRVILEYALSNELFKQIYASQRYTLSNGLQVKSTIIRYNTAGTDTTKIMGSKTGYTGNAGYCLSSLSKINGHEFIIVVLNATHEGKTYYHIVDTINLINFLENNYKDEVLVNKKDLITTLPIELSKYEKYDVLASKEVTKFLPSDYDKDKIKIEYKGLDKLSFLNKKGEKIGTITDSYDGEKISEEEVFLLDKLDMDIGKVLMKYIYIVIAVPVILIGLIILLIKRRHKKISA